MDLIDKRDEVLRIFLEYGINENIENDLTKTDLADCAEKIVEKLILSGVVGQSESFICDHCDGGFTDMSKEVTIDIKCYEKLVANK